ncbi:reverse transcriptase [Caerostris darwini]|uniref:Reverse transcriptase n=1 Tax=Caerostris darwini TaxID=1538125 RepID=A0AAV4QJX3_9ARAC|nr:reverse transcriptase [Caerostris darwini]
MRFVNKLRKKPSYGTKTLTVEEKAKAEIILWSIEQKKHFHEKENSVHGLQVVRGDDEVLRVKTRIIERDDDLSFLYPILLPSKHYLTECLIREYHLKYCHAGVQILAAKLRLQYWIFSSKRNIRSCVSRCVVCKRFTAKALTTPPILLPLDRVIKLETSIPFPKLFKRLPSTSRLLNNGAGPFSISIDCGPSSSLGPFKFDNRAFLAQRSVDCEDRMHTLNETAPL